MLCHMPSRDQRTLKQYVPKTPPEYQVSKFAQDGPLCFLLSKSYSWVRGQCYLLPKSDQMVIHLSVQCFMHTARPSNLSVIVRIFRVLARSGYRDKSYSFHDSGNSPLSKYCVI